MKKKQNKFFLLLCVSFLFNSASAFAQEKMDCEGIGELAATVMKARQRGVPISKMMGIATSEAGEVNGGLKSMILMAYKRPRYSSDRIQKSEIEDFRNQFELACYSK